MGFKLGDNESLRERLEAVKSFVSDVEPGQQYVDTRFDNEEEITQNEDAKILPAEHKSMLVHLEKMSRGDPDKMFTLVLRHLDKLASKKAKDLHRDLSQLRKVANTNGVSDAGLESLKHVLADILGAAKAVGDAGMSLQALMNSGLN